MAQGDPACDNYICLHPPARIDIFYGIEKSHHISLDKSIAIEWTCLVIIMGDLALRGYTYGSFIFSRWAHHKMFKVACLVVVLHLADLIMATVHAARMGLLFPMERTRFTQVSHCVGPSLRAIFIPYFQQAETLLCVYHRGYTRASSCRIFHDNFLHSSLGGSASHPMLDSRGVQQVPSTRIATTQIRHFIRFSSVAKHLMKWA